jgi:hypothetical protein
VEKQQQRPPKDIKTEQHQTGTDEKLFEKAQVDPKKLDKLTIEKIVEAVIKFGEALASVELRPYERDFAERIVRSMLWDDGATLTCQIARQGGKSTTVAIVCSSIAIILPLLAEHAENEGIKSVLEKFLRGVFIGVYGPDYERAGIVGGKINDILTSDTAKEILSDPNIGMTFPERISSYLDRLPRGSFINVKSANRRVSIEGDTYHLVITDETQEISEYVIKKSISPMLSSTNGTMVHIGSSYPKRVYFYDMIKMNREDDTKRAKRKRRHFEADYRVVQKHSKYYKKYVEAEKKKLGAQSDEFRMSYELYWPLESGMFVTEDFLRNTCGKKYYVTNYDKTNDHVVGIDLAKKGDSTVVTIMEVDWENPIVVDADSRIIRHHKAVTNWLELSGDDYDSQFYQICDFIDNFQWSRLVVDATGVGEPIFDRLYNRYFREGTRVIRPFVFTRPDKSFGYTMLYKELLAGRVFFPDNANARALKKQQKFVQQMANLSKSIEGGYFVVEHESESGHDDYPDSLMLAVLAAEEEVTEEIEEVVENIYRAGLHERATGARENNFWNSKRS